MRKLVFIHGRSQEGNDPGELKSVWMAALREGLTNARVNMELDESRVRFPFYGDRLVALVGPSPQKAPEIIIKGPGSNQKKRAEQARHKGDDSTDGAAQAFDQLRDKEKRFAAEIMVELAERLGLSDKTIEKFAKVHGVRTKGPLNWSWMLATMRAISSLGGGGLALSLFTHDVARYLNSSGVRDGIEMGILKGICPEEPTVVVSHSLGTIIAYNLFRREGNTRRWNVLTHISLGSPLAIPKIKEALAPIAFPSCVTRWLNGRDAKDMVALYPLTPENFPAQPITNKNDIKNKTNNHHGIVGYLRYPSVAKWIYDALVQ